MSHFKVFMSVLLVGLSLGSLPLASAQGLPNLTARPTRTLEAGPVEIVGKVRTPTVNFLVAREKVTQGDAISLDENLLPRVVESVEVSPVFVANDSLHPANDAGASPARSH